MHIARTTIVYNLRTMPPDSLPTLYLPIIFFG